MNWFDYAPAGLQRFAAMQHPHRLDISGRKGLAASLEIRGLPQSVALTTLPDRTWLF
jgi:hypothetical protein